MPKRVVVSWSGGKDSAWALHTLRQQAKEYAVIGLLTSINQQFNRVAIHGVRRELLEAQALSTGLPLWVVPLPSPCTNEHYERRMTNALHFLKGLGVDAIAFGDLYLQDIRAYRESRFGNLGLELLFPIWGIPTGDLSRKMIDGGLKARLTCVDPRAVPAECVGGEYDQHLLRDLPASVDPCAENGEFHTFVYEGPMLRDRLAIKTGGTVERDGFVFADLLLASQELTRVAPDPAILAG